MKRKIINIDSDKCTGCGLCIPNCPEGAIQLIDDKARLISDLFCDGLGACLGHCPEEAITIEEREAEPYDERKVMANIVKQGKNTIRAHLKHLKAHGETGFLNAALEYLKENNIEDPMHENKGEAMKGHHEHAGCPGSRTIDMSDRPAAGTENGKRASQLRQWPVQLHLVSPMAPYFRESDLLLAADCTAFALGDFHKDFLKGKSLAIACPKLDDNQDVYLEKLIALIDAAKVNTITVLTMEVPCCGGLLATTKKAAETAKRKVPVKSVVVSLQGEVLKESWV
ncbi:MAG: 4Fe-4S dicluster domain-containing protein [Fibrobacterota bacterium]